MFRGKKSYCKPFIPLIVLNLGMFCRSSKFFSWVSIKTTFSYLLQCAGIIRVHRRDEGVYPPLTKILVPPPPTSADLLENFGP